MPGEPTREQHDALDRLALQHGVLIVQPIHDDGAPLAVTAGGAAYIINADGEITPEGNTRKMSARHDAIRALADEFYIAYEGPERTSSDEDIRELLDAEHLPQWAAITTAGQGEDQVWYIYACETQREAQKRAFEHLGDDIYAEMPVAVVDLDNGTRSQPRWDSLEWWQQS